MYKSRSLEYALSTPSLGITIKAEARL
jgi:hypothetical protein